MKKVFRIIKKNARLIVGAIIVIFLVIIGIMAKNFFFPDDAEAYYGTRLEGIEKVKVKDKEIKAIKDLLKDKAKKVTVRIAGRLIYVDVIANDDTPVDTARDFGFDVLQPLTDEVKAYYDVQLLVNSDTNKEQFPIIGYKHHTREYMTWTKTR